MKIKQFSNLLLRISIGTLFLLMILMSTLSFFLSKYDELYQKAFSLKTKFVSSKHVSSPWVSSLLSKLMKSKSDYFFLHKLNLVSKQDSNRYRNKLSKLIKKEKSRYYQDLFTSNRNYMKKNLENYQLFNI